MSVKGSWCCTRVSIGQCDTIKTRKLVLHLFFWRIVMLEVKWNLFSLGSKSHKPIITVQWISLVSHPRSSGRMLASKQLFRRLCDLQRICGSRSVWEWHQHPHTCYWKPLEFPTRMLPCYFFPWPWSCKVTMTACGDKAIQFICEVQGAKINPSYLKWCRNRIRISR